MNKHAWLTDCEQVIWYKRMCPQTTCDLHDWPGLGMPKKKVNCRTKITTYIIKRSPG